MSWSSLKTTVNAKLACKGCSSQSTAFAIRLLVTTQQGNSRSNMSQGHATLLLYLQMLAWFHLECCELNLDFIHFGPALPSDEQALSSCIPCNACIAGHMHLSQLGVSRA